MVIAGENSPQAFNIMLTITTVSEVISCLPDLVNLNLGNILFDCIYFVTHE